MPSEIPDIIWASSEQEFLDRKNRGVGLANIILSHPQLIKWYTQNYDGGLDHHKLEPIPLGMNFHSEKYVKDLSPEGQSAALDNVVKYMLPRSQRIQKIYMDSMSTTTDQRWKRSIKRLDAENNFLLRSELVDKFRSKQFVYKAPGLPRQDSWIDRAKYAFSISPRGNGLDCHRTWESLVLGQIVILKSGPLDRLYEDLPVVIIDDWNEVTLENLKYWAKKYEDPVYDKNVRQKLSSSFWRSKVLTS